MYSVLPVSVCLYLLPRVSPPQHVLVQLLSLFAAAAAASAAAGVSFSLLYVAVHVSPCVSLSVSSDSALLCCNAASLYASRMLHQPRSAAAGQLYCLLFAS